MSEFSKQFNLWHIVNDKKYKTATLYRKALCKKFRNWKSPEDYSELSQEVRALKVEIEKLKADKQLVVVPKMVGEQIERVKGNVRNPVSLGLFDSNYEAKPEYAKWIQDNINTFMSAWIDGYTVEREKLYRLKNKITNQYINMNPYNGHCQESMTFGDFYKCVFTQSEIDDMETGSYEQIAVTVNEV